VRSRSFTDRRLSEEALNDFKQDSIVINWQGTTTTVRKGLRERRGEILKRGERQF
jgi:uncharacterized protein